MSSVKIDNVDLSSLGIFILRGGDFDLLSFPERKNPVCTDWFENDGLDCDLSQVLFKAKKVVVKYALLADDATALKERLNAFETLHFQRGYRALFVAPFSRTFQLRTLEFQSYKHKGGLTRNGKKTATIEIVYAMDNPLQYFQSSVSVPSLSRKHLAHVRLNGYDFSKFGVIVRQAYNTLLQPVSPKLGVVWDSSFRTGQTADVSYVSKKRSRKLVLECTMIADSYSDFEQNYTALFRQLTKTGALEIGIKNGNIPCYYNKMEDFKKEKPFRNGARVSFNLELTTL